MSDRQKLIEVALSLAVINKASAREKSIRDEYARALCSQARCSRGEA